jgi:hypothetical protein
MAEFLDKLEAVGPSNANFSQKKYKAPVVDNFHKILPYKFFMSRPSAESWKEP